MNELDIVEKSPAGQNLTGRRGVISTSTAGLIYFYSIVVSFASSFYSLNKCD
jgi:hypothetical protein